MKKIIISCMIALLLVAGCAGGIGLKTTRPCIVDRAEGQIEFNQFCVEVQEKGKISYICNMKTNHNLDACYLHRTLEIVSLSGVMLDVYEIEDFVMWANYLKKTLKAGMSYNTLRLYVMEKFTSVNKSAGASILLLGSMFLQLPQYEIIPEADIILINSSIDDLVNDMQMIYGTE